MNKCLRKLRVSRVMRFFYVFLIISIYFTGPMSGNELLANTILDLPSPGHMVELSDKYHPATLKGLTIYPDKPFEFDFIIDTGELSLEDQTLRSEANKLIKYFLTSLTVSEDEMWVNLSPYEQDRIVPFSFGQTEMGRDLLAQDYMLKQLAASLMYPEKELGGRFWRRVHTKALEQFGTADIKVDTFNKIWIIPEKAVLYVNGTNVFVVEQRLRVMLEEDYLAMEYNWDKAGRESVQSIGDMKDVSAQIVREILIPEIEKEVNEGKTFANLRQIFSSLILASWYKKNLKETIFARTYVNKNKTNGVDVRDKQINQKIYDQYVRAFEKGVYNYIKEEYDEYSQSTIPKQYFSGGVHADVTAVLSEQGTSERFTQSVIGQLFTAKTFARATHDQLHRDGNFNAVIRDIAEELDVTATDGIYNFNAAVTNRGGVIKLNGGGQLSITQDGILVITDKRFKRDHAGRGAYQLAVYASSAQKALHELTELRAIILSARELGILREEDEDSFLGERIRSWTNEQDISSAELLKRQNQVIELLNAAHNEGLIAEGKTTNTVTTVFTAQLSQPIKNFDFMIASDGVAGRLLFDYLRDLQERSDMLELVRSIKIIAAVINDRAELIRDPDPMPEELNRDTLARLDEFKANEIQRIIEDAGLDPLKAQIFSRLGRILNQHVQPMESQAEMAGQDDAERIEKIILTHLEFLQTYGSSTELERTMKVVSAAINMDPVLLKESGPIADVSLIRATLARLGEFNVDVLEDLIQTSGRSEDFESIRLKLMELISSQDQVDGTAASNQVDQEQATLTLTDLPAEALQKRRDTLNDLRRAFIDGALPEVISFGDKHGRPEDLERIVNVARRAARSGQTLTIVGHGDGFDRGPDNIRIFELFKELKQMEAEHENITVKLLWGNHDAWLVQTLLLDDQRARELWLIQGGQEVLDQFESQGKDINELAMFMLANFELYHVDEWGYLHLHAGIPIRDNGDPRRTLAEMEELGALLENIQKAMQGMPDYLDSPDNRFGVSEFFSKAAPFFYTRRNAWVRKFIKMNIEIDEVNKERLFGMMTRSYEQRRRNLGLTPEQIRTEIEENWEEMLVSNQEMFYQLGLSFQVDDYVQEIDTVKLDRFLVQMGVNGVIAGHDHHSQLLNVDNRIFGIDVDDYDVGHLVMNGRGIMFNGLARSGLDQIVDGAGFLAHLSEQVLRIRRALNEDSESEDIWQYPADTEAQSGQTFQTQVASGHEEVFVTKSKMERYQLGLKIAWDSGGISLNARRPSQNGGSIGLADFDIVGLKIARILYRDSDGRYTSKEQMLLPLDSRLDIGRDNQGYVFILDGSHFYPVKQQEDFVLVQSDDPVDSGDFILSRTIFNLAGRVSVQTQPAAASSTTITPFLDVDSPEEAMDVFQRVFNLTDYSNGNNDDNAVMAEDNTVGGIDLNPVALEMDVRGDQIEFYIPVSNQPVEIIPINGYVPVIIQINPTTNLNLLLGHSEENNISQQVSLLNDVSVQ